MTASNPTIWLPPHVRAAERVIRAHPRLPRLPDLARWLSRIGNMGGIQGGLSVLSGVGSQLYGANGPSFSDTLVEGSPPVGLNAHTPTVGISWIGDAASFIINPSGKATPNTAGRIVARANPSPISADCYSQAVCVQGSFGGGNIGPVVRWQDANTYYYVFFTPFFGDLILMKRTSGSDTSIGSSSTTAGSHTVKLTAQGTSIKVFVDGVQKISVTDSGISAAGYAGVEYAGGGTNNGAFTSYESSDL